MNKENLKEIIIRLKVLNSPLHSFFLAEVLEKVFEEELKETKKKK